ncbi:MAG: Cardiolipin synthase [Verrucomicrobia subdivision 3 bacterium]|nr:Cardiolipin synthase [Limisphaerales bacterium]MCS1417651.1 Cardiolipin synthase [Limisphaerales bacterium]
MMGDECWTMTGSADWDARSLRLNFEFNVEYYSQELAQTCLEYIERKLEQTQPVTLKHLERRPLPIKI